MSPVTQVRPASSYQPALDGLRALSVLAVFAYHAAPRVFPGGLIGVDVFFVLSGFLITTLLLEERAATGTISFGLFYQRRALRLFPALVLCVLLVGAFLRVIGLPLQSYPGHAAAALTYTMDFVVAADPQTGGGRLSHTWSLAVEEQFYILWPPVLLLLLRARSLRVPLIVTAVTAGLFAVAKLLLWRVEGVSLYFLPWGHFDEILIGACAAMLVVAGRVPFRRIGVPSAFSERVGSQKWLEQLHGLNLQRCDRTTMYYGLEAREPLSAPGQRRAAVEDVGATGGAGQVHARPQRRQP